MRVNVETGIGVHWEAAQSVGTAAYWAFGSLAEEVSQVDVDLHVSVIGPECAVRIVLRDGHQLLATSTGTAIDDAIRFALRRAAATLRRRHEVIRILERR